MKNLITFKTAKLAYNSGFDLYKYIITFPTNNKDFKKSNLATEQSKLRDWILENKGLFVSVDLAYNKWGKFSAKIERKAKDGETAILATDGTTIFDNQYDAWEEGLQIALEEL
jgi:hypothetical protein